MSRKIILALTAIAALGIAALAPTSASAFGHFGGGHGMSRGHVGHSSSFARSTSFSRAAHRPAMRSINRGPHLARITHHHRPHHHHQHFAKHHHHHHCHHSHKHCGHHYTWWWRHHHRPYWVAPVVGETVVEAAPVAAVAPVAKDNCNCLTKTYLEDGSVMFKDICTKEAAVATPDELKAQAAGAPPAVQTK